jgi:hypothetical protein
MNRRVRNAAAQRRPVVKPWAGTEEPRATHQLLLELYRWHLWRELAQVTALGVSVADCVAIIIRTEGDDDIANIVRRADAIEIAEVAGLDRELVVPPPATHLHVFTFACFTGAVRSVRIRALSLRGRA